LICLGVDPGQSRVGLALGQDSLSLAIESIDAESALDRIAALVSEKNAERIYVGLPLSLSGDQTASTKNALDLAKAIAERITIPVFVVDERLSTAQSLRLARSSGKSAKESKSFIDAEAARLIVESAISSDHKVGIELGDFLARH
jgi:putative Holliday junction resolvase